jgi:2-iminobutanoate/2-iminopropanoate deaminase
MRGGAVGLPWRYISFMKREVVSTTGAPAAIGPYSQAIRAQGEFLFISGQIPLRPDGTLVSGPVEDQMRQCLANLRAVLEAVDLTPDHLVKTTIFLSSMEHFTAINIIYGEFFEGEPPARATVAAAGLPKGVDVEVEGIAVF